MKNCKWYTRRLIVCLFKKTKLEWHKLIYSHNLFSMTISTPKPTNSSGFINNRNKATIIYIILGIILVGVSLVAYFTFSKPKSTVSNAQIVNVNVKKEDINFSYSPETKTIKYSGKVYGQNGCVVMRSHYLSKLNNEIILNLNLGSNSFQGKVCTQQLVTLPIEGSFKVELNNDEQKNLINLISVKVNTSNSNIEAPLPNLNETSRVEAKPTSSALSNSFVQ
jgi:hypothetical protein